MKLQINGTTLLDRTTEVLEYEKRVAKIRCDAHILFLAHSDNYQTALNASRIDSLMLILETEQTDVTPLHLLATNLNIARFADGLFGN